MGSIEPLAYTYASLFGIVTEDDYPYASGSGGNDDHCDFDATTTDAAVMTMGFETLPHNDAAALMSHLANKGELSNVNLTTRTYFRLCGRLLLELLPWRSL